MRQLPRDCNSVVPTGHCDTSNAGGDCQRGSQGSWLMTRPQAANWSTAFWECERRCLACANCRFISFSINRREPGKRDCSWWTHSCDLRKTLHAVPGFRSYQASAAAIRSPTGQTFTHLVFLHLPKTGGISFANDVSRKREALELCGPLHCWSTEVLSRYGLKDIRGCNLVACEGHLEALRMHTLRLQPSASVGTVLLIRQPIEHQISLYRHCQRQGKLQGYNTRTGRNLSFAEWLQSSGPARRCNWADGVSNLQTRRIASSLPAAVAEVRNALHVGVTSYYRASVCLLLLRLSAPLPSYCACGAAHASSADALARRPAGTLSKESMLKTDQQWTHYAHNLRAGHRLALSPLERKLLQEATQSDEILYAHALTRLYTDLSESALRPLLDCG